MSACVFISNAVNNLSLITSPLEAGFTAALILSVGQSCANYAFLMDYAGNVERSLKNIKNF